MILVLMDFHGFPGYALDLEKGIRLNMMFGESSDHPEHNAAYDMIWNPTSVKTTGNQYYEFNETENLDVVLGGRHYVYVMKTQYAGSDAEAHSEYDHLTGMSSNSNKRSVFRRGSMGFYTNVILFMKFDGDIKVKIRVSKQYDDYNMEDSDCEADASTENDGNLFISFNTNSLYDSSLTNVNSEDIYGCLNYLFLTITVLQQLIICVKLLWMYG